MSQSIIRGILDGLVVSSSKAAESPRLESDALPFRARLDT